MGKWKPLLWLRTPNRTRTINKQMLCKFSQPRGSCNSGGPDGIGLKTHSGENQTSATCVTSKHGKKLNKWNQCDFSSTEAGNLIRYLKTHSDKISSHNVFKPGEKLKTCNQCDFSFLVAVNLRRHLITHSGEKSNKCDQCDFASIQAGRQTDRQFSLFRFLD